MLSKMWKKIPEEIGPDWLRWILNLAASVCMGAAVAISVQWVITGSLSIVWEWAEKWKTFLPLTVLLYSAAVYLVGALVGRLWLSGLLLSVIGLGLALVDYFKTAINGAPLSLADFGLATQLGNVAGVAGNLHPPIDFWYALVGLTICVLLLAVTAPLTRLRKTPHYVQIAAAVLLSIVLFTPLCIGQVGERFSVDVYTRLDPASSHNTYGLTVSLWRDLLLQHKNSVEGYSADYMRQDLERIDQLLGQQTAVSDGKQPNVIMILSESFYDLTRLPGLTYDADPLANYHALQAESISGTFHSHYLGYGTGYLEMSMHTGWTDRDLGAGTNICFMDNEIYEQLDSLTEQFTNTGTYTAEMLHAFDNSLYNRTVTYPLLGYSDLLFSPEVQQIGGPDGIYGGYYMKDSYLYQVMLRRMEALNADGKRAFLYGISMGNHQPFNPDKFFGECQIGVKNDTLSEEDMAIVRVMLEGITRADQALGLLVEELRQSEEPTIVVFFGDHRPNLTMTDGNTVYQKLGLCPTNDTVDWTVEQINDLYSTDYLIWANDAALLQGQAGTRKDSSITAVGPQLLELTGIPASRYWRLLELCEDAALTNTDLYFVDGEGTGFRRQEDAALTAEQEELLQLRSDVIYDALYGEGYLTAAMNERP